MMENNNVNEKNELQLFTSEQFGQIRIMTIDGEDHFNLYDTMFGLGYTKTSKGKLYLRKDEIENICETLDIKGLSVSDNLIIITKDIDFENTYVTEDNFYDLCIESKAKNARSFRKWITSEVLPSLRKRGVYIMENAKEDIIDNEKLFGKRRVKNTFANAEVHDVEKLYDDCINYINDQYSTKDKIKICQSIFNGLSDLSLKLSQDAVKNMGKCYDISLLQNRVIYDKAKYQNKRNGGIKSSKTKTINKLNPPIEDYMVFDIHPMSENYMYQAVNSFQTGEAIMVRTNTYKNWLDRFPVEQAINKDELDIDWTKPIKMFIKVDCLAKFDSSNFIKATNDMILNRIYLEDDSIAKDTIISTNKIVDEYSKGKIYVYIQNL